MWGTCYVSDCLVKIYFVMVSENRRISVVGYNTQYPELSWHSVRLGKNRGQAPETIIRSLERALAGEVE